MAHQQCLSAQHGTSTVSVSTAWHINSVSVSTAWHINSVCQHSMAHPQFWDGEGNQQTLKLVAKIMHNMSWADKC